MMRVDVYINGKYGLWFPHNVDYFKYEPRRTSVSKSIGSTNVPLNKENCRCSACMDKK